MSQIKYYIIAIFICFFFEMSAQNSDIADKEKLQLRIENFVTQAGFDAERGNYFEAKDQLESALKLALELEDQKQQAILHTKLGVIEMKAKKYEEASISFTKAVTLQRSIDDHANLGITYSKRGLLHAKQGDYSVALDYYKSAKTRFEEEDMEDYIPELAFNEGHAHLSKKDYQSAKSSFEQSILLAKKHEQLNILSAAQIANGEALSGLGNHEEAISITKEGIATAKKYGYINSLDEGYRTLSIIYKRTSNDAKAYDYLQKHVVLHDSLIEVNQASSLALSAADISTANAESELKKYKQQVEEHESDSNLAKITTILSIALITILSLLTLSLYKNNNIRLKTNNMLHEKNDDLIEAMKRAELASKTKANFLSTVTHELRTPLYAVTGLTGMLLDENPREEQIPHLKSLKFSGDYLLTFINDILQINKIEANKVELDPELFDLRNKVENVVSALTNSANDNNTKMHFDYQKGLPQTFIGDNLKISQILINLIGNSIKFTKDGDIWVRVYSIDQKGKDYTLRFEIEDNGIGISKEKQEHMFESFSQGSIQINRKYGGTGLGLSIVKGLIDILNGKIYVKSELGKGTTFFFEIPLTYAPETVKIEKEDFSKNISTLDLSTIKILIVEDNKINQMITKKILTKMNLQCEIVDNGEDAVEKVKANNYDVVLMDIHMPGISGLEATRIIRTFDKELTIFALTAVTLEDKMQEFDEAGFDDIISKPFKQEDFEKKLFSALEQNQSSPSSIR